MRKMTEGSIARHLLAYAIPMILGNFFQLTYNAVDAIVIGKFAGEGALAAVSAANPVMTIVVLGVSGISIGASVLMSRFYGAGDLDALRREVATTLIFGAVASAVVFALGLPASGLILRSMNVPGEILPMAVTYLRIIFVGFLFTFQYNVLAAAMRSVGDSRTPVVFLAITSVLNGALDLLFVAGFGWGVAGAGLATVLAEGISMIAAFNAVSRMDDFAFIPEQSIASGMMVCIAQNRGAGKSERVSGTLLTGMKIEAAYGLLICLATLLLKRPIMLLFAASGETAMVQMGVDYLSVMAFLYIIPGITNGIQGYFRGMGEMRTTLVATFIQISVRALVIYLLVPRVGLQGAAWACAVGWGFMLLYTGWRYRAVSQSMKAS